jgi:hypothetical protein
MSLRKGLLAMFAGIAVAGAASAEPPVNPLVEGREPDPVVRQFHDTERTTFGYSGAAQAPPAAEFATGWLLSTLLHDMLLDRLTMPLGTVPMWD